MLGEVHLNTLQADQSGALLKAPNSCSRVLDEIDGMPPKDIGYDLLPRSAGRARAVLVEGYFRDVGTTDGYRRAREEWPARAS